MNAKLTFWTPGIERTRRSTSSKKACPCASEWGVELYVYEVGAILVDHGRQWLDPAPERLDFRSPFWTNFGYEAFPEFDSSKTQIQVAEPSTLLLLGLGACAVSLRRHGTMRRRLRGRR